MFIEMLLKCFCIKIDFENFEDESQSNLESIKIDPVKEVVGVGKKETVVGKKESLKEVPQHHELDLDADLEWQQVDPEKLE